MYSLDLPKEEIIQRIQRMDSFPKGNIEVLLWAAINGYNDIIQNLIEVNKANPEKFPLKFNKYFNLALRYAAMHEQIMTINLLLRAGADSPDSDICYKMNKKISEEQKEVIKKYKSLAPGCVKNPERYNYYLLDWIMDNSTPAIFDIFRKHIEEKNPPFRYTNREIDPDTGLYKPRWKAEKDYEEN